MVVEDHDIAGPQGWNEEVLDIGSGSVPCYRSVEHQRRGHAGPVERNGQLRLGKLDEQTRDLIHDSGVDAGLE